jgi:predicted nucleotide-binding protein
MGYFIGRIGRNRVSPLQVGLVEIPSDYAGVVYTEMDSAGAWKVSLVRELKEAGFNVDANKAFA